MKRITTILAALALLVSTIFLALPRLSMSPALAADQTITLAVEGMYCDACPLTVRTAIRKVAGVKSVTVDYKTQSVVVTFDALKTTADAVVAASTNVGYPASVVKIGN